MQKLFVGSIKSNKLNLNNFINKNFATLIVPEILNGKIHASILNLTKAASQLDKDVKIKIKLT